MAPFETASGMLVVPFQEQIVKTRTIQCLVPCGSQSCSDCTIRSLVSPLLGMKPPRTLLSSSPHLAPSGTHSILRGPSPLGSSFPFPENRYWGDMALTQLEECLATSALAWPIPESSFLSNFVLKVKSSSENIDLCFLFRHSHQPSGRLMCVRYRGPRDPRSKEG